MTEALKPTEATQSKEAKVVRGQSASHLSLQSDAVCDGQRVRIGSLERKVDGTYTNDVEKKTQAVKLAAFLSTPGILNQPITAEQILNLSQTVAELTDAQNGKFAGIYINCLNSERQGESTALAMATFITFIAQNSNLPQNELIDRASDQVHKVLATYHNSTGVASMGDPQIACAVVGRDGKGTAVNTGGNEIAVIGTGGVIQGDKIKPQIIAGKPKVQEFEMKAGDRIVLCAEGKADQLIRQMADDKRVYTVDEMADYLGTGEKTTIEKTQVTSETGAATRAPKKDRGEKNTDGTIDEPEDETVVGDNYGGVIDAAGGAENGEQVAKVLKLAIHRFYEGGRLTYMDEGKKVVVDLEGFAKKIREGKLTQAEVEKEYRDFVSTHLNRMLRTLNGEDEDKGAGAVAFGNAYENENGQLDFTYAIRGDSEIAIVSADGTVRLIDNHSIRCQGDGMEQNAGGGMGLGYYLASRERIGEWMGGRKKGETQALRTDPLLVGSVLLRPGDRIIYLTDGAAEDLQNIRGAKIDARGNVTGTPTKDADGRDRIIGLDILGKIPADLPADQVPSYILKELLDGVRNQSKTQGTEVTGRKKIIDVNGLKIVVGGKGPNTYLGWDDAESIVCLAPKLQKLRIKIEKPGKSAAAAQADKAPAQEEQAAATMTPPETRRTRKTTTPERTGRRKMTLRVVDDDREQPIPLEDYIKRPEYRESNEYLEQAFSGETVERTFPKLPNESRTAYRRRLLTEVDKRIRNSPNYGDDDWVVRILAGGGHPDNRTLAKAIEANMLLAQEVDRAQSLNELRNLFMSEPADRVLSSVRELAGNRDQAEGPYNRYFGDRSSPETKGAIEPEARLDLLAFRLVSDQLLGVEDPTIAASLDEQTYPGIAKVVTDLATEIQGQNGRPTYRALLEHINEKLGDSQKKLSDEERFQLRTAHAVIRERFYQNVERALEHRRDVRYAPAGVETSSLQPLPPVVLEMARTINTIELSAESITKLIDGYQGFHSEAGKKAIQDEMRQAENKKELATHLFDLALKGAERWRRTAVKPVPGKKPQFIKPKRFVEGPQQEAETGVDTPPGGAQPGGQQPGRLKPAPTGEDNEEFTPPTGGGRQPLRPAPADDNADNGIEVKTPPDQSSKRQPKPPKIGKVKVAVVSAKKQIGRVDEETGQQIEEIEVLEHRSREGGRMQMTEDKEKWQGLRATIKQIIPRFWKFTTGDTATYAKEKSHRMKVNAEAGFQLTDTPLEFQRLVDKKARENIEVRRKAGGGDNKLIDLAHELTFTERELHRERQAIVRQLRRAVEGRLSSGETVDVALLVQYKRFLSGDLEAAAGFAHRFNTEFGADLVHGEIGERLAEKGIKLEGPLLDLFINNVALEYTKSALLSPDGKANPDVLLKAQMKMQEIFNDPTFAKWYYAQDKDIQDSLRLSLSYGSDFIQMLDKHVIPIMRAAYDHEQSISNIDDYIRSTLYGAEFELMVGTGALHEKGVIGEGVFERKAARAIKTEEVLKMYQEMRDTGHGPWLVPDAYLDASVNRSTLVSKVARLATNNVAVGLGTAALTFGVTTVARIPLTILTAGTAGGVAAAFPRFFQEWRLFTREWEQHKIERQKNYEYDTAAKRRAQMGKIEGFDKPRQPGAPDYLKDMDQDIVRPMQETIDRIMKGEELTDKELALFMGRSADVDARMWIGMHYGEGLFKSTNDQSGEVDTMNMELTNAQSKQAMKYYIGSHMDQFMKVVGDKDPHGLGFKIGTPLKSAGEIDVALEMVLTNLQGDLEWHLKTGRGINTDFLAALGDLTIDQKHSIDTREEAFNTTRGRRALGAGLQTMAFGVGFGVLGEFGKGFAEHVVGPALTTAAQNACGVRLNILGHSFDISALGQVANPNHLEPVPGTNLELNLPTGYHVDSIPGPGLVRVTSPQGIIDLQYQHTPNGDVITGVAPGAHAANVSILNPQTIPNGPPVLGAEVPVVLDPAHTKDILVNGVDIKVPDSWNVTLAPGAPGHQVMTVVNGTGVHTFDVTQDASHNLVFHPNNPADETLIPHAMTQAHPPPPVAPLPPSPGVLHAVTPEQQQAIDLADTLKHPDKYGFAEMQGHATKTYHVLWPEHVKATQVVDAAGKVIKPGDHAGHELQMWWPGKGIIKWTGDINEDPIAPHLKALVGDARHDAVLMNLIKDNGGSMENKDLFAILVLKDGTKLYAPLDAHGEFHLPPAMQDAMGKPDPHVFKSIGTAVLADKDGHVIQADQWVAAGKKPLNGVTEHYLNSLRFEGDALPPPPTLPPAPVPPEPGPPTYTWDVNFGIRPESQPELHRFDISTCFARKIDVPWLPPWIPWGRRPMEKPIIGRRRPTPPWVPDRGIPEPRIPKEPPTKTPPQKEPPEKEKTKKGDEEEEAFEVEHVGPSLDEGRKKKRRKEVKQENEKKDREEANPKRRQTDDGVHKEDKDEEHENEDVETEEQLETQADNTTQTKVTNLGRDVEDVEEESQTKHESQEEAVRDQNISEMIEEQITHLRLDGSRKDKVREQMKKFGLDHITAIEKAGGDLTPEEISDIFGYVLQTISGKSPNDRDVLLNTQASLDPSSSALLIPIIQKIAINQGDQVKMANLVGNLLHNNPRLVVLFEGVDQTTRSQIVAVLLTAYNVDYQSR